MKAYTDIEQSKKLAEILPLESADMSWCNNSIKGVNYTDKYSANLYTVKEMQDVFNSALHGWDKYWELIPAWSLAALLEELPDEITTDDGIDYNLGFYKDGLQYYISYRDFNFEQEGIETDCYDDFVDACYEMILNLHEQNLI